MHNLFLQFSHDEIDNLQCSDWDFSSYKYNTIICTELFVINKYQYKI